jgi:hypothetical protein
MSCYEGAFEPGLDVDLVVLRKPILVINGGKVFLRKSAV